MKRAYLVGMGAAAADQFLKALIISARLPHYPSTLYSIWIALSVVGGLFFTIRKQSSVGLTLVLAGGLSNCFDLILRGAVVDIFVLKGLFFNLADVAVALGACLTIVKTGKDFFGLDYR